MHTYISRRVERERRERERAKKTTNKQTQAQHTRGTLLRISHFLSKLLRRSHFLSKQGGKEEGSTQTQTQPLSMKSISSYTYPKFIDMISHFVIDCIGGKVGEGNETMCCVCVCSCGFARKEKGREVERGCVCV